jgi:hypothetical protein
VIEDSLLRQGLDLIAESVNEVLSHRTPVGAAAAELTGSAAGGVPGSMRR